MARRPFADADRALFWTFAIAAFAAATVGLAARAIDRAASGYEQQRHSYAIVRVLAPEGPDGMAAAQNALRGAALVKHAAPMSPQRAAALMSQWSGSAPSAASDLPPLSLIEVDLNPAAPNTDIAGDLRASLAQAGVTAQIVRAPETQGAGALAERARVAALVGALGFAFVMALIISFAARGLATRRREMVEVLADLGATRGQAGSRVANEASLKGFSAGLVGAALAALAAGGLLWTLFPTLDSAALMRLVTAYDLVPLAATPIVVAVAAAMGARAGAESFYAQAARLA